MGNVFCPCIKIVKRDSKDSVSFQPRPDINTDRHHNSGEIYEVTRSNHTTPTMENSRSHYTQQNYAQPDSRSHYTEQDDAQPDSRSHYTEQDYAHPDSTSHYTEQDYAHPDSRSHYTEQNYVEEEYIGNNTEQNYVEEEYVGNDTNREPSEYTEQASPSVEPSDEPGSYSS